MLRVAALPGGPTPVYVVLLQNTAGIDFVLHTYRDFANSIELGRYTVNLKQVAPYPTVNDPIDPDAYIVTVLVSRGSVAAEKRSWSWIKALYR